MNAIFFIRVDARSFAVVLLFGCARRVAARPRWANGEGMAGGSCPFCAKAKKFWRIAAENGTSKIVAIWKKMR
jgi:hypothetical protein